jgi:2-polyprenyl-6-methoxyphenol hydroxylase-like FAD-dependent oxidoreductase
VQTLVCKRVFTGGFTLSAFEYDAIAVGAGPTGLSFALEMQRHGMSVLILDRLAEGLNTSRAAVIHARTLEVLESSGVTADLLAQGVIVPTFRIRERDEILLTIKFDDLDSKYPFTLMCPQDQTEATLLSHLNKGGGGVQRPCEVSAVHQLEDGGKVDFQCDDLRYSATAKWIVGCDGSHSVVRQQAGIPFEGGAYPESFILADVEMDWSLGREEVTIFVSPNGLVVVAPFPNNRFRIVATVEDAPSSPAVDLFQRVIDERGPQSGSPKIIRSIWSSRFHIEHKVAKRLRSGNLIIIGDAAHVHSPAGGQGMNTGIQDAVSLATAIKADQDNSEADALIEWEKRRLKAAHQVVSLTDRATKMATIQSPFGAMLRNAAMGLLGHFPAAQHSIATKIAELDNR